MNISKLLTTATTIAALSISGVAHAAIANAPQKIESTTTGSPVQRASATSDKKSNLQKNILIVAGLAAAIAIGGAILVSQNDEDNFPLSP